MREELEKVRPGAAEVLQSLLQQREHTWTQMQHTLKNVIPNVISVTMNPGDSSEMTDATVQHIESLIRQAKRTKPTLVEVADAGAALPPTNDSSSRNAPDHYDGD